jgi:hypothetical protein
MKLTRIMADAALGAAGAAAGGYLATKVVSSIVKGSGLWQDIARDVLDVGAIPTGVVLGGAAGVGVSEGAQLLIKDAFVRKHSR